jgi:uncharacterized membrane protein YjjP (DUF1212 family)
MPHPDQDTFQLKTEVLTRAAELLHRYGTPSHRLEGVMQRVSRAIGVEADYLYTPTSLFVSFRGDNRGARLMRIDAGPIELGKLADFDEALERLEHHEVALADSLKELELIADAPPRYDGFQVAIATAVASVCATAFLKGGWIELLIAFFLGLFVHGLSSVLNRIAPGERLLEFTAGFSCAMIALLVSAFVVPLDDRIATLGALIVLLPGLGVTISMTELANRHLSSGVSRLAGAGVIFLTLAVGVALAWRLGANLRPAAIAAVPLSMQYQYVAMLIAPLSFIVLFQARLSDWLQISLVAWSGFLAAQFARDAYGVEWGAFVGAAVVGLLSNVYARFYDRPSLIPQMPAILMLVPGSLGYYSVTAFIDQRGVQGLESAFSMVLVAMALAGGLITANAMLAPKRFL